MASILEPSVFQIKIKEEHIVKGIKTLNETNFTLQNITNVDRRFVTVPLTTSIDLINVNGIDPGAGTFPSSSMKYVRISNLEKGHFNMQVFADKMDTILNSRTISAKFLPKIIEVLEKKVTQPASACLW